MPAAERSLALTHDGRVGVQSLTEPAVMAFLRSHAAPLARSYRSAGRGVRHVRESNDDSPSAEDVRFENAEGVAPYEHRDTKARVDAAARRIQSDNRGCGQSGGADETGPDGSSTIALR